MATTQILINFLQQPLDFDKISYTISNNGSPIVYTSGVNSVDKTFRAAVEAKLNRIAPLLNDLNIDYDINFGNGANGEVFGITKQSSGKLIVYGAFTAFNGITANRIVRLNTDGSVDATFVAPAFNGLLRRVHVDGSDNLYVLGDFFNISSYNRLIKLSINGAIVGAFAPVTFNNTTNDIHLHTNGDIYAIGSFTRVNTTNINRIVRLNGTTGAVVSSGTFNPGTAFNSVNYQPYTLDQQSDGKLVIGGDFSGYGSNTVGNIVRITAAGAFDSTFNTGGTGFAASSGVYIVRNLYVDGSDRVYCTGRFTAFNGNTRNRLIRLTSAGADDTSNFTIGTGLNDQGFSITESSDGKIVIGGNFTTYKGLSASRLLKLNTDGSAHVDTSTYSFNSVIRGVFCQTDSIIVGGAFVAYTNSNSVQTQLAVPISVSGVTVTQQNLYDNLSAFNIHADVLYSTSGSTITVTYSHDLADTIVIDEILDAPGYVEIEVVSDDYVVPATFILSRSPFFYKTTFSPGTVDTARIDLFVYKGNFITDTPVTPTYTFNKQIVVDNQDTIYFNVANFLREFNVVDIDNYMLPASGQVEPLGPSETTWVKLELTAQYSGVTVETLTSKYLTLDGYGWVEDGVNPVPSRFFISADQIDINRYGQNRINFTAKDILTLEYRDNESEFFVPIMVSGDTQNNSEYIMSILLQPNDTVKWMEYKVTYTDEEITKRINILDECFYNPIDIIFKNKHGLLQTIPFQKKSSDSYSVGGKDYDRSLLTQQATYNPRLHSKVNYLVNGEREITLNTGYVKDYFNDTFKELIHSEEIYMYDGTTVFPVYLSDKSWNVKTQLNDKLINYTLKFKLAQDTINQII